MANEFNNITLINADGILSQDEWNAAIYDAYSMDEIKEYSSEDFVKSKVYSEFNDSSRGHAYGEDDDDDDDDNQNQGSSSAASAAQTAVTAAVQTVVAACVGAAIIAGSYAAAVSEGSDSATEEAIIAAASEIRWEWSADHTSAEAVVISDDGEVRIPAEVSIEENAKCTEEGEVDFYAKALATEGKYFYGEYSEAIPPTGHDFEVYSAGKGSDGKAHADFVCKICGEHFVVDAEYTEDE